MTTAVLKYKGTIPYSRFESWRGSIDFVFRKVISLSSCGQGRQSKLGQGYDIYMEGEIDVLGEVQIVK